MTGTQPEWTTEERTVPVKAVDENGNEHIVEKTVTERVAYVPIIPHTICAEHNFALTNGGRRERDGRLIAKCGNCGMGKNFVLGQHRIVDGKIENVNR